MQSQRMKLIFAIVIAGVGVAMVSRMLVFSKPKQEKAKNAYVHSVSTDLDEILSGDYDTKPTHESVEADIARATVTVKNRIDSVRSIAIPAERRADLAAAFEERLAAIVDPVYMRDLLAKIGRGQQVENRDPDETELNQFEMRRKSFKLPPMDIQSIEIYPIFERGVYIAESMTAKGFGEGTTKLGGATAFPMSGLDPVKHKLDVVEVRIPMEIPVPISRQDETRERNLVGFQFVWSKERQQWIPWVIKTYGNPNHGVFGLPF